MSKLHIVLWAILIFFIALKCGAGEFTEPRSYVCYRTEKVVKIDGKLDDEGWITAAWTEKFVDIEGKSKPKPRFQTRAKMLWDDKYMYLAAELEEPDIWATLTERDSVIFYDNDFEVFIDPDGDTHNYYEFEANVFGTVWDLMLLKPYRDGGPAITAWDIRGLKVTVDVDGTINNPGDKDHKWTIEIAMPWNILREAAFVRCPPKDGDQWRINFSRVEWQVDVKNGTYKKKVDSETGERLPEHNWVWSPQGAINMHMPERWGYVQFSDRSRRYKSAGIMEGSVNNRDGYSTEFVKNPNEKVKWALRLLYYRQRKFYEENGHFATDLHQLNADDITIEGIDFAPVIRVTESMYEITVTGFNDKIFHIRNDGKVF